MEEKRRRRRAESNDSKKRDISARIIVVMQGNDRTPYTLVRSARSALAKRCADSLITGRAVVDAFHPQFACVA
jgi:hypothetical protein